MRLNSKVTAEVLRNKQRDYFYTGRTKDIGFRQRQLRRLRSAILQYEPDILAALKQDLGKCEAEAYMTEIGVSLAEISHALRHVEEWAEKERVKTPLYLMPAKSKVYYEPLGTVLIIGPFNYPFQLIISPLVGAISAGNCAVVKPSEKTPHTAEVLNKLLEATFSKNYICCIEGERESSVALTQAGFDHIFFTGSAPTARRVMEAAAKTLTPVTLELGGKSPVIVTEDADIALAARRIVYGKFLNAGQTCVAPDYVLVQELVKNELLAALCAAVVSMYGKDIANNSDYGRIVDTVQFDKLADIIDRDAAYVIFGGIYDRENLFVAPTVLSLSEAGGAAMEEEIFGPILPVLPYQDLDKVLSALQRKENPLAVYVFTNDHKTAKKVMCTLSFGGGCINDTIFHVASTHLPFGGSGQSGMGAYHGKESFLTFSHKKSIYDSAVKGKPELAYPPYQSRQLSIVRKFFK